MQNVSHVVSQLCRTAYRFAPKGIQGTVNLPSHSAGRGSMHTSWSSGRSSTSSAEMAYTCFSWAFVSNSNTLEEELQTGRTRRMIGGQLTIWRRIFEGDWYRSGSAWSLGISCSSSIRVLHCHILAVFILLLWVVRPILLFVFSRLANTLTQHSRQLEMIKTRYIGNKDFYKAGRCDPQDTEEFWLLVLVIFG